MLLVARHGMGNKTLHHFGKSRYRLIAPKQTAEYHPQRIADSERQEKAETTDERHIDHSRQELLQMRGRQRQEGLAFRFLINTIEYGADAYSIGYQQGRRKE